MSLTVAKVPAVGILEKSPYYFLFSFLSGNGYSIYERYVNVSSGGKIVQRVPDWSWPAVYM